MKNRGYGIYGVDFLTYDGDFNGDIITNPPYKYALEFVEKALSLIPEGNKVAMFLRIQFLEGIKRGELFDNNPPKTIYVARKRLQCAKSGVFEGLSSSATAYCWFVWEKGFKGNPIIKWINK